MNKEFIIKSRLKEHAAEASHFFAENNIVGLFLQGSQNYGLDYEGSDIDTKLIVTPTLEDIVLNKQPVSTTHEHWINDPDCIEHIDFKDIRLMFKTFEKQNVNFIEILFTKYYIINEKYKSYWNTLIEAREEIARYNPYKALKTMVGQAANKYSALQAPYPSKKEVLEKFGYDPKQLHHILRVYEFIQKFIAGYSYEECLQSSQREYLINVKKGCYSLEEALPLADNIMSKIKEIETDFCSKVPNEGNPKVIELLESVQYHIIKDSLKAELLNRK